MSGTDHYETEQVFSYHDRLNSSCRYNLFPWINFAHDFSALKVSIAQLVRVVLPEECHRILR